MDQDRFSEIRRLVNSAFKFNGLMIKGEAANYLVGILAPLPDKEPSIWIDRIVDRIQTLNLKSTLIDRATVEIAVKECGKGDSESADDILSFVDAFDVPKFNYDPDKKKFLAVTEKSRLLCEAVQKPLIYRNRYTTLLQRALHHELFSPTMQGSEWQNAGKKFTIRPVEFLVGSSTKVEGAVVLGMISQMKEGKYYIEDATGSVELDISETKFHTGLYCENCFVLAEGMYDEGIFYVKALGLPPPETALVTRSYHGAVNFFGGGPSTISRERLEVIERQNEGAMFIILSDVHLDKVSVLEKLRVLFDGYSETPPVLFIFMGNFLAEPHGIQSAVVLKDCFKTLADLIAEFPMLLKNSKFVIIPGPTDPGFVNILPRPPFADCITQYFREKVPNVVFTSNPIRIKYCTKIITVFREDILTKLCRNSIYFPTSGDIPKEFVSTIVGQGHLCPLPLHICPVYWSFDHALYLYPLPDLVIIGGKGEPFTITNHDSIFTNPGSFLKTEFSFKVYTPYENKVEDCQIPD